MGREAEILLRTDGKVGKVGKDFLYIITDALRLKITLRNRSRGRRATHGQELTQECYNMDSTVE